MSTVRTYRIRIYSPHSIENFHSSFLSPEYKETSFELEYKNHRTRLTKRSNRDFLIDQDDYNSERMIIFSGEHDIHKSGTIKVDEQLYEGYYVPNTVELLNFPTRNILLINGNKTIAKHFSKGFQDRFQLNLSPVNINLKSITENESDIKGVVVNPNTANCDTVFGWGTDVHTDENMKSLIDNPNSNLSQVSLLIEHNGNNVYVGLTADGGIVIFKNNDNLKDDLDIVFKVYNNIIKRFP